MRAPRLALLAVLALTPVLAACGGDDEVSDAVPRSTPELTIPTATTEAPAADGGDSGSSTTSTTSTSTTPAGGAAAPATPAPAAPAQPAAPATGGQAPSDQSTTGGSAAGGGEFEDFCAQNPGAC